MSLNNINSRDKTGRTALHHAAQKGDLQEVKRLVAAGADVNIRSTSKWQTTALHEAAYNVEIAWYLIDHGADVNAEGKDGYNIFCFVLFFKV